MEHVIVMAFSVKGDTREQAMEILMMAHGYEWRDRFMHSPVVCWWVAEDDRTEGSDNDSTVFVSPGNQSRASHVLYGLGLTPRCNLVSPDRPTGSFEGVPL